MDNNSAPSNANETSDSQLRRFFKAWSGHLIFLVLNFIIVLANIVFPRYIDTPRIEIASVEVIVDEDEVKVHPSSALIASEVFQIYEAGDAIVANKHCFNALRDENIIPSSCNDKIVKAIDAVIAFATKERESKLSALSAISTYSKEQLVSILSFSGVISYRSAVYNDIFFNFLAVDEFAKDELAPSIKNALLSAAKGLVKREFEFLDSLKKLRKNITEETNTAGRSGVIAFRVIALNSGYKGGVIFPNASLRVAGKNITLIQDSPELLADPIQNSDAKHELLEAGKVVSLYYVVDYEKNTSDALELIETIVKQASPLPFDLTISTSNGDVSTSGNLSIDTISFELTFGEK